MLRTVFSQNFKVKSLSLVILLGICGCSNPPASVGGRAHDELLSALVGQQCETEKRDFIIDHKAQMVENIDLLFGKSSSSPDPILILKRLEWLNQNNLDPIAAKFAAILDTTKDDLSNSLHTLFGDIPISLPSEEQIWNAFEFTQRDDVATLAKSIQTDILELKTQSGEASKELFAIAGRLQTLSQSEDARFIGETFFGEFSPSLPSKELAWRLIQFGQRDEVKALAISLSNQISEFAQPTKNETREILEIMQRLRALDLSKFANLSLDLTNEEQLSSALSFIQRDDLQALAKDLVPALSHELLASLNQLRALAVSEKSRFAWNTLLKDLSFDAFTEEQAWAIWEFTQRDDVKGLFESVYADLFELVDPTLDETKRILKAAKYLSHFAKSEDGLIIRDVLFGGFSLSIPSECQAQEILRFLRHKDVARLTERLISEVEEFRNPTQYETAELIQIISKLRAFDAANDRIFLKYIRDFLNDERARTFLLDLSEITKDRDASESLISNCLGDSWWGWGTATCVQVMNLWFGLDKDLTRKLFADLDVLHKQGLLKDALRLKKLSTQYLDTFKNEQNYLKRLAEDFKFQEGDSPKLQIQKYFADENHRKAARLLSDFLFEKQGLESLVQLSNYSITLALKHNQDFKILQSLLRETDFSLEDVTPQRISRFYAYLESENRVEAAKILLNLTLRQNGLVDRTLDVAAHAQPLFINVHRNMGIIKSLGKDFGFSDETLSRDQFAKLYAFLKDDSKRTASVELWRLASSDHVVNDILRLSQLMRPIFLQHQSDLQRLQKLAHDFGLSLSMISNEHIGKFVAFIKDEKHQVAAKMMVDMASKTDVVKDLLRLHELSRGFVQGRQAQLALVQKLATDLGLNVKPPVQADIDKMMEFVSDTTNQTAAKTIAVTTSEFVIAILQSQEQLASFPMGSNESAMETAAQLFGQIGRLSREDIRAASTLSKMAFDLWSMAPENQCKPVSTVVLRTKDLKILMAEFSAFLTTSEHGFRSWISLLRRMGQEES